MDVEEFSPEALAERAKLVEDAEQTRVSSHSLKERFRRTMFFQEVDVRPNFEFGYWDTTLRRWHKQGLPEEITDEAAAYNYFGIEKWAIAPAGVGVRGIFKPEVLEETDEYIIKRDNLGVVQKVFKSGETTIPHYIDFPVKDRATWEPWKEGLNPDEPGRWGNDELIERLSNVDVPIGISGGSLVGVPRNIIGFERIAVMPYEDPELFQEIVDTFGRCIVTVLDKVLPKIQVDFCMGWEDICFNQGPVVSPEVFDAVAGPWYRRIADVLMSHGCCIYTTDTDGNINPITDTFLNNGLNTMFPVEVKGGSDPVALRERYGKRIRLWGGVDKMALMGTREAIDAELERLKPYVEQGGFIAGVDHRVPEDVPYENYIYYLDRKRELFKVGGEPQY